MQVNGWTLLIATAHGVRIWQSEEGLTEVRGVEGLSMEQLNAFIEWCGEVKRTRQAVPVSGWAVAEQDLADLLEWDADDFAQAS